jgi:hypothetical protein
MLCGLGVVGVASECHSFVHFDNFAVERGRASDVEVKDTWTRLIPYEKEILWVA